MRTGGDGDAFFDPANDLPTFGVSCGRRCALGIVFSEGNVTISVRGYGIDVNRAGSWSAACPSRSLDSEDE